MLSRVLSRATSAAAERYVYHPSENNAPATSAPEPASKPDAPLRNENQILRQRIAELEQALAREIQVSRQAGMREGEASGRAQAEAAVKPVIDRMCSSVQDLIQTRQRIRKELEEEAVHLSLGISKRILRRELSIDPSALHGLIQAAFERLARQEITRVIVHPDHVSSVREALDALTTRNLSIESDGSREKGTLIFVTSRGNLDASIDSQLKEIELGLADRLKWR